MTLVNMQEAKTTLSRLVARAERGERVILARAGQPVVELVPVAKPERHFGGWDIEVPDDFDAPLSDEELSLWDGGLAD